MTKKIIQYHKKIIQYHKKCNNCSDGEMVDISGLVYMSSPPQCKLKCNKCDNTQYSTKKYPYKLDITPIEIEDKWE